MTHSKSNTTHNPLKIAVLTHEDYVSCCMKEIIDWAKQQANIEIQYIFVHKVVHSLHQQIPWRSKIKQFFKRHSPLSAVAHLLLWMTQSIESYHLRKKLGFKNHLSTYKVDDLGLIPIKLNPCVSDSGQVHRFHDEDLMKVKALDLDLLLCFGGPALKGGLLELLPFGVIRLHHADTSLYRGSPTGFWEVFEKNPISGFVIQKLESNTYNGTLFVKGLLNTKPYWQLNQIILYTQANYYLKDFLQKLATSRELPQALPHYPYSHRLYSRPNIRQCLQYFWQIADYYLRKRNAHGKWHVAFLHQHWREAVLCKGIDFPKTPGIGLADPFLYSKDGKDYCFLEEIEEKTGRGHIAVYQIFKEYAERLGTILKENYNVSYPYLFEYNDRLFMLPETNEIDEIRIYECTDFPLKWQYKQTIMKEVSAVDSTLIPTEEGFWLLTNQNHSDLSDHCPELTIYFAKNPLTDEWTPHPKNPIYIDAFRSRNAGFFTIDNQMYRVSQSQGIYVYGESAFINQITELNHKNFKEKRLTHLTPNFKKHILGIHHFHTNGRITVFDYFKKK